MLQYLIRLKGRTNLRQNQLPITPPGRLHLENSVVVARERALGKRSGELAQVAPVDKEVLMLIAKGMAQPQTI